MEAIALIFVILTVGFAAGWLTRAAVSCRRRRAFRTHNRVSCGRYVRPGDNFLPGSRSP
jgi:hypothetical protein